MSKIGLILVGHNCAEYFDECLNPWLEAKKEFNIKICAVNCPFEGFPVDEDDESRDRLIKLRDSGEIDHLIMSEGPIKETEARGAALKWLVAQDCEISIMVDFDEVYQLEDIRKIIGFVEKQKFTVAFKVPLKNYVFNTRTYLAQPFEPFRIHRLRHNGYEAYGFWDDNNVQYRGTITRDIKYDIHFPYATIPSSLVFVKHFSWISNYRSRCKCLYQQNRQWVSSFIWDEKENTLKFNPIMPEPKVIKE